MDKIEVIGNLTTIAKILIITFAPTIAVYLGTDANTTITLLSAIVGCIFGLVDAKYPNTLFKEDSSEDGSEIA